MTMAGHISKLHNDLIYDCGTLSGEEVASLMDVMEAILSTPPSFYNGKREAGNCRINYTPPTRQFWRFRKIMVWKLSVGKILTFSNEITDRFYA